MRDRGERCRPPIARVSQPSPPKPLNRAFLGPRSCADSYTLRILIAAILLNVGGCALACGNVYIRGTKELPLGEEGGIHVRVQDAPNKAFKSWKYEIVKATSSDAKVLNVERSKRGARLKAVGAGQAKVELELEIEGHPFSTTVTRKIKVFKPTGTVLRLHGLGIPRPPRCSGKEMVALIQEPYMITASILGGQRATQGSVSKLYEPSVPWASFAKPTGSSFELTLQSAQTISLTPRGAGSPIKLNFIPSSDLLSEIKMSWSQPDPLVPIIVYTPEAIIKTPTGATVCQSKLPRLKVVTTPKVCKDDEQLIKVDDADPNGVCEATFELSGGLSQQVRFKISEIPQGKPPF